MSSVHLPRFGPFYRLESPTQTPEDASAQSRSGEIWGRTPWNGRGPAVKAYRGSLPTGSRGIEFYTASAPDFTGHPLRVLWSTPGEGLEIDVEWAKLKVIITENTQQ